MANPIHPGEILLEEYLKPLGVSQNKLARSLRITPKTISEIVLEKRQIAPEMSIRLGSFLANHLVSGLTSGSNTISGVRCAQRNGSRLASVF